MDCVVHGVAKSQTRLSDFLFQALSVGMEIGAANTKKQYRGSSKKKIKNKTTVGSSNSTSGYGSTCIEIRTSERSLHPRGPGFNPCSRNQIVHVAASLLAEKQRFHVSQLRPGTAKKTDKQIETSPVAQWLRICLSVQGTQVWSPLWEGSIWRGAAKPFARTTEPSCPLFATREASAMSSLGDTTRE